MADRRKVLWIGSEPDELTKEEFKNRDLNIEHMGNGLSKQGLELVTAVVFSFTSAGIETQCKAAKAFIPMLLDFGIGVDLVAPDDKVMGEVQRDLGALVTLDGVIPRTDPKRFVLAERAARHRSGKKPRIDLEITVADDREPIRPQDLPLFERAFHDCKRIILTELTGGRSDARIFSVYATVDTSVAGIWPQPFFAKLDRRAKIVQEAKNYQDYAIRFIPFGLRPNIDKVILGSERGLLVGDFVDRSESLWDMVRRNVAASAISGLIDETLAGWRIQGYANDPIAGSIATAMEAAGIVSPSKFKITHCNHARTLGVQETPDVIWAKLKTLKQVYREAPVHGDLHGENIRVRNGQAILIDLASVGKGPLTVDFAALETWFAFEFPPEEDKDRYVNTTWQSVVDPLYLPSAFQHPPRPASPTDAYAWLTAVVRQIRHLGIAIQSCPGEYQSAVAAQVLRRCQWDDGCPADKFRRAHGYVIACRLTADLEQKEAT